jgi:hypothetical protein
MCLAWAGLGSQGMGSSRHEVVMAWAGHDLGSGFAGHELSMGVVWAWAGGTVGWDGYGSRLACASLGIYFPSA